MNFLNWNDSTSALLVFKNRSLVPVLLRNRWHNACNQGIQVIFKEGNCCADLLANMGHSIQSTPWFSVLPQILQTDSFLDRSGFPRSRFPQSGVSFFFSFSVSFFFFLFFFSLFLLCFFEGFGLVPSLVLFPLFLIKFSLKLAVQDGGFAGCQPSWDTVASPLEY